MIFYHFGHIEGQGTNLFWTDQNYFGHIEGKGISGTYSYPRMEVHKYLVMLDDMYSNVCTYVKRLSNVM